MKNDSLVLFVLISFVFYKCGANLSSYGNLIEQKGSCPMITNKSSDKIISFTVQFLDSNREIIGSGVKTLKPGEAKLLDCEGAISRISGAVEVAPANYG